MMHSFTGNPPFAAKRISAATRQTLPELVASPRAGQGESAHTVMVFGHSSLTNFEHARLHGRSIARAREEDRIFCVTTACTSCGTCEAVCPVKNIMIAGKKPAWKRHCELCFACIRTCPAQAIRIRGTNESRDGAAIRN